jgi:hypothetical protein
MRRRKTVDAELILSINHDPLWPSLRVHYIVPKRIPLVEFLASKKVSYLKKLDVAINPVFISEKTARLFACDCAERGMMRKEGRGSTVSTIERKAIHLMRIRANGAPVDNSLIDEIRARIDGRDAWYTTLDNAYEAARLTASWSAWGKFMEEDQGWQISHLIEMIEMSEEEK